MTRLDATNLCHKYHIDVTKDFFTLSPSEVENILQAANEWGYRKPKNANGSRGRYFFSLLQRATTPKNFSGFVRRNMTPIERFNKFLD
jgi:hypothetical protein